MHQLSESSEMEPFYYISTPRAFGSESMMGAIFLKVRDRLSSWNSEMRLAQLLATESNQIWTVGASTAKGASRLVVFLFLDLGDSSLLFPLIRLPSIHDSCSFH